MMLASKRAGSLNPSSEPPAGVQAPSLRRAATPFPYLASIV